MLSLIVDLSRHAQPLEAFVASKRHAGGRRSLDDHPTSARWERRSPSQQPTFTREKGLMLCQIALVTIHLGSRCRAAKKKTDTDTCLAASASATLLFRLMREVQRRGIPRQKHKVEVGQRNTL